MTVKIRTTNQMSGGGGATVIVTTTSLPTGTVSTPYSTTLAAIGGTAPYTWSATGVPAGLTLSTAGVLSGTPTTAATDTLVVTANDSSVPSVSSGPTSVTLTINASGGPTWFGAALPATPAQFSTTSSPPIAANTNRGSYYTPGVGADASLSLQAAVNAAAAATGTLGDVIVLQAGTTYATSGGLVLPVRGGSGWIYIISSQAPEIGGSGLPAAGTRIGRANIPNMATLGSPSSGFILTRVSGNAVSYYRFVGIDMEIVDGTTASGAVVWLNMNDSTQAQHITFDRCYIAGGVNGGARHGINLEGNYMELTESMVERVWQIGNSETHGVIITNSTGPYKIHNNWLDANGETSFVGGGDIFQPSPAMPSDITITNNHYHKARFVAVGSLAAGSTTLTITSVSQGEIVPATDVYSSVSGALNNATLIQSQLTGTPRGAGTYQMTQAAVSTTGPGDTISGQVWTNSKNAIEFKVGQRVLVDSNFFENAFGGQQNRSATVASVRNQAGNGGPGTMTWYALLDFTISNNVFTNCQNGGWNILLQDTSGSAGAGTGNTAPSYRLLWRNNIVLIGYNNNTNNTTPLQIMAASPTSGSADGTGGDVIFDHNTFLGPANGMVSIMAIGGLVNVNMQLTTVVWSNNIWDASTYGLTKAGTPGNNWTSAVVPQIATPVFTNNVTVNLGFSQPAGNFIPANVAAVGFTNYGSITAATGYSLTTSSPYHAKGVNGAGISPTSPGTPDNSDIGCNVATLPTS